MRAPRMLLPVLFCLGVITGTSDAIGAECTYNRCDAESLGLTRQQWQAMRASMLEMAAKNRKKEAALRRQNASGNVAPDAARADGRAEAARTRGQLGPTVRHEPSRHLRLYLRQDFEDVGIFSAPKQTSSDEAVGAEFSWTRDRIKDNTTWAGQAMVAAAYSYVVEDIYSTAPVIGFAIGPYFGFTRELHSRNVADNVNVMKFGFSSELGLQNLLFEGTRDYFRMKVAGVQDEIKNSSGLRGTFSWFPVWLAKPGHIGIGGVGIQYNWTPQLLVQFDEIIENGKTIAFSDQSRALRIGPQAVLWFKMSAPNNPMLEWLFARTSGRIVYHWWGETYSGRSNGWLDAALTHNLDRDGNVALKFSYRRGRNEDTGARTDLFKISLSAKTCTDLYSTDPC